MDLFDDAVGAGTLTQEDLGQTPLVIPTMEEVLAIPWNGLKAVGSFSGCGGSSLGLRMAGFRVPYAIEFIPAAAETYRANAPGTIVDERDVRKITAEEILQRLGIEAGELDVFEGSPPCASFSAAGSGDKDWGKVKKYCLGPVTQVLRADLTWCDAEALQEGDRVIGFDEEPVEGACRKFRTTEVTGAERLTRPGYRLRLDDGTQVVCSGEHRWLVGSGRNRRWKRTDALGPGDELLTVGRSWMVEQTRDAGWLAGFMDGEGCVGPNGTISITQRYGPALDRARAALAERGYQYSENPWADGEGPTLNVLGGLSERLRLLGTIYPERLVARAERCYKGRKTGMARRVAVRAVEYLGEQEVIAVSTGTKTLIAEGVLSHNSDSKQRTDDLFEEWMRLLEGLQPRAFIAENVPGMLTGRSLDEYARVITKKLSSLGYYVHATVLNATWYGVPQERRRILFVGIRKDQPKLPSGHSRLAMIDWPPPVETSVPHTVAQALALVDPEDPDHAPYLAESSMEGKAVGRTWRKMVEGGGIAAPGGGQLCEECGKPLGSHEIPITVETNAIVRKKGKPDRKVKEERWVSVADAEAHVRAGGKAGITKSGAVQKARCADGKAAVIVKDYFMLTIPEMDKPFPTVTATGSQVGAASVTHPTECRKLTPAEAKAACAFPQDFVLTGTREQRYERMGRAVPPLLMRAVARTVARALGADPS